MRSKLYPSKFLMFVFIVLAAHLALVYFQVINIDFRRSLIGDFALLLIFLIGIPIVLFGLKKDAESFVGSFLVLTTMQMLSAMATIAAFIFTKIPGFRELSIQYMLMFIIILGIQSIFLINVVRNYRKKD